MRCQSAMARLVLLLVLMIGTMGCETTELSGPDRTEGGQLVTYTLELSPYYSHDYAEVFVVAEIPEEWTDVGWSYEGEIDGDWVTGNGVFTPGEPGLCPPGAYIPFIQQGYRRVYGSSGPFPTLVRGRDHVSADLTFVTGSQPGVYALRFLVHVQDATGVTCSVGVTESVEVVQSGDWAWEMVVGVGSPVEPGVGGVPGEFHGWTEFQGRFYADVDYRVWRTADFENWEMVLDRSPEEYARGHLAVFNDRLVAVCGEPPYGYGDALQLWSTLDGATWDSAGTFVGFPLVLTEYGGELLFLVKNYDGVILFASQDGSQWSAVGGGPMADFDHAVSSVQEYAGLLYIGGSDSSGSAHQPMVWTYDGSAVSPVAPHGAWPVDSRVFAFEEFDGMLYAGFFGWTFGAELWTLDGGGLWSSVVSGLTQIGPPAGFVGLERHDHRLFAWISGSGGLFETWSSLDGLVWETTGLTSGNTTGNLHFFGGAMGSLFVATGDRLWRFGPVFQDGFETGDLSRWSSVARSE